MRAIAVLHYPVFGGPHNQFAQLSAPLADADIDLTVIVPDTPGNAADRLQAAGARVIRAPLGRLRASADPRRALRFARDFRRDVRTLERIIRDEQADLVFVSGLVNPHAGVAAARANVPVVWQIIDTRTPEPALPAFMAAARRYSSVFMFWGDALRRLHTGTRPLVQPYEIFGPAVNAEAIRADAGRGAVLRERHGIPTTGRLVGTLANVNPQKGVEYFGRAAARIYREVPDAWFVVVGALYDDHAAYASQIEQEVHASGVPPERFVFTGHSEDVGAWLGAFDVKLVTSVPRSEGIPTTVVESLAAGTPVVTTDVGAVREAVLDGETGLVVAPLDDRAIAAATIRLLGDRALAARFAAAGVEHATRRFSVEACVSAHSRAAHGAVAAGNPRSRRR